MSEWIGPLLKKYEMLNRLVRLQPFRVFIGWDAAEEEACGVARLSLERRSSIPLRISPISMFNPNLCGIYRRPTTCDTVLFDTISGAPMSTSHAIARFFIPYIAPESQWVLFMDGDVLARRDVGELFALADDRYAVQVVKHAYEPTQTTKKGNHEQGAYPRKNWSSVILWNLRHRAHERLSLHLLNTVPGRDLHRFCWLTDDEIGALPEEWNWLVGHSQSADPAIVHFTEGLPTIDGHADDPYADEWLRTRDELCLAPSI